ncbi:ubiquitin carboxyl-terminal hydrolase 8-like [Hibiscus syriacus]|uniref:Ubiquitin carboxyl-terminal hydrolase 8-like n=2 Tax=Hibiscus syriacus TaxID=106335 RepID=A0A6A2ZF25_HIBSY|nr:ubiquitin carboxyl-terminal hydrolase 8-like [Hibiscus syriacus]
MLSLLNFFKWFQCICRGFLYLIAVIGDERREGKISKETQIHTICSSKQDSVLQLNQSVYKEKDCKSNKINAPESVVNFKDQRDEETELEFDVGDQGIVPREDDSRLPISSKTIINDEHSTQEVKEDNEEHPVLSDFEEKCPPGGEDSVVFYTTSLRGIRKTFEDCSSIRFLLDSFKILVQERDVSMDMRFREELWRISGGRVVPPKLFIKGRDIGGADEVFRLHEQGNLKKLLEGIPSNCMCTNCANIGFLVCSNCNGSCKVFAEKEGDELCMKCPDCNENGLVKCPVCC